MSCREFQQLVWHFWQRSILGMNLEVLLRKELTWEEIEADRIGRKRNCCHPKDGWSVLKKPQLVDLVMAFKQIIYLIQLVNNPMRMFCWGQSKAILKFLRSNVGEHWRILNEYWKKPLQRKTGLNEYWSKVTNNGT